jgi:anti-anti-sigma regulatory factor
LKVERQSDGKTKIISAIGQIRAEDLEELKKQIADSAEAKVLNLSEVTIVDADVIRFLSASEREGARLMGCPPYIREWILRERAEEGV